MQKLELGIVNDCIRLRIRGFSLGEISSVMKLSKSTVHAYVKNILLDSEQIGQIENRRKAKNNSKVNPRKGKCLPGREIKKPKYWSDDLVHVVAHFMFDGRVDEDACIYYSKDEYQITHMKSLLEKIFKAKPKIQLRDNGVYGLSFYHVELANYIKNREKTIFSYLNNDAVQSRKRLFLQAFFDDEGNVFYKNDKRRVRGYQKSFMILEQIRELLINFGIKGKINKNATDIEISGQCNLTKFAKEINFSPEIYINPLRRNGIWKRKISKRRILNLLLSSYQKNRETSNFAH